MRIAANYNDVRSIVKALRMQIIARVMHNLLRYFAVTSSQKSALALYTALYRWRIN